MSKHFCCGVDFECELEEGMANLYSSETELKAHSKCWEECGIVEFEMNKAGDVVSHKWIVEQDLYKGCNLKKEE